MPQVAMEPQMLLRNVHNGSVASFFSRAWAHGEADDMDPYTAGAEAVTRLVQHGHRVIDELSKPDVQTCRQCGCTDQFSCAASCWWVEDDLCTSCVGERR